jgi:uncharacterized membrane-anchored protein YjiN (DUF445 family)
VEDRIFDRLVDGVRSLLEKAAEDPEHELRVQLDRRIEQLARDLQTSPQLRERGEQWKRDVLDQPQLREWTRSIWSDAKKWLREQSNDPDSELRRGLAEAVAGAGARLRDDPVLQERVQQAAEQGVRYVAEHFNGEIANLVRATVARWDGEQTAERLELLLGPDLQFIRINGTIVGGLAGLVLYSFSQLVA